MPHSRSSLLLNHIVSQKVSTLDWLIEHGIQAKLCHDPLPKQCCINMHSSRLEIIYQGMHCILGPDGQFKLWYHHIPHQHPLIRLIKRIIKKNDNQIITDATCGLGRDSLLLALFCQHYAPECTINSYEQNPLCAAIATWQSQHIPKWHVFHQHFEACQQANIVLIDPMFPPHPKTAKPNKYSQLLQHLTQNDSLTSEHGLIAHAQKINAKLIYLKHPPWKQNPLWTKID